MAGAFCPRRGGDAHEEAKVAYIPTNQGHGLFLYGLAELETIDPQRWFEPENAEVLAEATDYLERSQRKFLQALGGWKAFRDALPAEHKAAGQENVDACTRVLGHLGAIFLALLIDRELPDLADAPFGPSNFFIRVSDLSAVQSNLKEAGGETIVAERTTFYGARETTVRAPCGTVVTFAQFGER